MKKFALTATIAVALMMTAFTEPAKASGGPYRWFAAVDHSFDPESKFNITMQQKGTEDIVIVNIENPGRKNLSVTLNGPDGIMIDNFFTGRKFLMMHKNYNFTGADEGLYTLVISDGANTIRRKIKFERITPKSVNQLVIQ